MAEKAPTKSKPGKHEWWSDKGQEPGRQLPLSGTAAEALTLQKTVGNQTVSRFFQTGSGAPPAIQAKMAISQPGDRYEQEADRIAEMVTTSDGPMTSSPSAAPQQVSRECSACASGQQTCPKCAEKEIRLKPASVTGAQAGKARGTAVPAGAEARIESLQSGGQPLPNGSRAFFESRFNYDFSGVRVHTGAQADEAARELRARAFTIGQDVVFGAGQFAPESSDGQRLLAHELTHVVQQTSPPSPMTPTVQREASSGGAAVPAPDREKEAKIPGLIVEDSVARQAPGQMKKAEFLAALRAEVCRAAEAVLSNTGRTTEDCPYLNFWFDFYGRRESGHIERAVHKYAPEASGATTASAYIPPIVSRIRRGVEIWAATGQITGVPEDMVADAGMSGASGSGGDAASAKGGIQFKANDGGASGGGNPQAIRTQLGEGNPLDGGVKSRMESAYGRSFSHVRIHADGAAASVSDNMNARAFTVGEHIAFGTNEYQPGSLIGDAIIAHELAHVVQQGNADHDITPAQMAQGNYEQYEEDADQSAMAAAFSLWGRTKSTMSGLAKNFKPRLRSGLQLQACRRTVKQCPRGLRWAVVGQPTATGPVCVCAWRCLPPGSGFSLDSSSGGSSGGPAVDCQNKWRGKCPGEPDYVTVDDDYEVKKQGTVVGVGAHMSPLGGQAACGCLPLTIDGAPDGQTEVHAPMLAPGLDITDLAGPAAEMATGRRASNSRTGVRQPDHDETPPGLPPQKTQTQIEGPPIAGQKPSTKTQTETPPAGQKPTTQTETPPAGQKPTTQTETPPAGQKPTTQTETPPAGQKPTTQTETPPAQTATDKLSALKGQRSTKQAELKQLQQSTRELQDKLNQAENDRQAASREYDKAATREAKDQAVAKMREAKARKDKSQEELDKLPSDDSLQREIKKLNNQIEAETPKPPAPGRDPLDVQVEKDNPTPPAADRTKKIGENANQDKELQKDIQEALKLGATDIRVNQEQVNAAGKRVGINRPDLQYTLGGVRVYIEYDTTSSGRGPGHEARIKANDPQASVQLKIID